MIYPTKYTFLLPAYKAKFFAEALESIKNQTHKVFFCIVSDDCSPENLKSIYDEVVGTDSRFTYRRNDENMGGKSLVSHWNLLVEMCETEFFIMASDDDVYEQHFLDEINKLTIKYPDVDLFRAKMRRINDTGQTIMRDGYLPEYMDQAHFFFKYYCPDMLICEANYCYRTLPFKHKGYYEEFPQAWFTDDATHIKMAEKGCAISENYIFCYRESNFTISNIYGDAKDATVKIKACFLFHHWISLYAQRIKCKEDFFIIPMATELAKKRAKNIFLNLFYFLPPKDFIYYSSKAQNVMGESRIVLIYLWSRVYCRNKITIIKQLLRAILKIQNK